MVTHQQPQPPSPIDTSLPVWLKAVHAQTRSLRYGQIQILIHDSRVVQIERVEKFRLEPRQLGLTAD
mgnify:CR=1 FL=1